MSGASLARLAASLAAGALFGFGLALSGMADPARVLGFLNLAGAWDPSLMFVLGGAVPVAALAVLLARRLRQPLLDEHFHLPTNTAVDRRLVTGSALFGAGWGLAGFCPGPALSMLSTGTGAVLLFVVAMAAGMVLHDGLLARSAS